MVEPVQSWILLGRTEKQSMAPTLHLVRPSGPGPAEQHSPSCSTFQEYLSKLAVEDALILLKNTIGTLFFISLENQDAFDVHHLVCEYRNKFFKRAHFQVLCFICLGRKKPVSSSILNESSAKANKIGVDFHYVSFLLNDMCLYYVWQTCPVLRMGFQLKNFKFSMC